MKIILCLNISELATGGWRSHDICKRYPGAGWLPYLAQHPDILSSREAGAIDAENMLIVQEDENPTGLELIEKGAKGQILFCLESPLFAPLFYDRLPELKSKFPHRILFKDGTVPVYFPSFDRKALRKPDAWQGRRPRFCMVTSNKHYAAYQHVPGWRESPAWKDAVSHQLHDHRYLTIEQLSKMKMLDLFGKGWPKEMNAPELPAGEKDETLRRYQYGVCVENTEMPGYVTEKIIDCLVAGVIPYYHGAPDIDQYVPSECFLKIKDADHAPSSEEALQIIQAGQDFLRGDGDRFSHQAFAERILALLPAPEFVQRPSPSPSGPPPDTF